MQTKITHSKENAIKHGFTFHIITMCNITACIIVAAIFINSLQKLFLSNQSENRELLYNTGLMLLFGFFAFINFLYMMYGQPSKDFPRELIPTIVLVANISQPSESPDSEKKPIKIDIKTNSETRISTTIEDFNINFVHNVNGLRSM